APGEEPEHLSAALMARDRAAPLWILEDCHASTHPLSAIGERFLECKKTELLFVARAVSPDLSDLPSTWPFNEVRRYQSFMFLRPNVQVVRGVIDRNLPARRLISQPSSSNWIKAEDVEWALQTTGGNLRTLKSFLDSWDPAKTVLQQVQIEDVYE